MNFTTWASIRVGAIGLATTLLVAPPLHAGEKTDVLYMKNGDRLTCEIKALDAGALQVSLDYVEGTISVQWSLVERLDSKRLFIVKLSDGTVYTGTLSIAETVPDQPPRLQISSGPGSYVLIDKKSIVVMGETSNDFWQRLAVNVSSGIIYSKGNQSTQYNLASTITYPRPRWGLNLDFNSSLSKSEGVTASTRNQLTLGFEHLLPWNNYYYAGDVGILQSTEQGIDLRTSVTGGIGRYFKHTGQMSVSLLGGLGWQNTQYSPSAVPETPQDILALVIAGGFQMQSFSKTNLDISASVLPALSEPGRFFFNTNATYYLKLWSNLTLNVSFYGSWDTDPPETYSGSDYGISSGLGWSFGTNWMLMPTQ